MAALGVTRARRLALEPLTVEVGELARDVRHRKRGDTALRELAAGVWSARAGTRCSRTRFCVRRGEGADEHPRRIAELIASGWHAFPRLRRPAQGASGGRPEFEPPCRRRRQHGRAEARPRKLWLLRAKSGLLVAAAHDPQRLASACTRSDGLLETWTRTTKLRTDERLGLGAREQAAPRCPRRPHPSPTTSAPRQPLGDWRRPWATDCLVARTAFRRGVF